jgi:putative transposase
VVDYCKLWSEKADIPLQRYISWLEVSKSKFYTWIERYGKANEHNAPIPRDFWLEDWERQAIISFCLDNPLEGYRRLTFMMLDRDIVAVSPVTSWRVLSKAGLLAKWNKKKSLKGTGFVQPLLPHEHWHVDISYINIHGTFYYLCSLLDGCSRYIVHWEIREQMTERDVEIILQRAKEKFPEARPRIISDNGPQFIAKDFKEFIRISGMTHVRTSPFYPQSNGKLERFHQTIKGECIRPGVPLSLDDARRIVEKYIEHYNTVRLHSAIGYVAPADKLSGRDQDIFKERDIKLETARELRKQKRRQLSPEINCSGEAGLPLTQAA